MKKSYETPQVQIIELEEDIITDSELSVRSFDNSNEGSVNFGDLFSNKN